jgi:uncharacterized membrane protein (DUF441 family)
VLLQNLIKIFGVFASIFAVKVAVAVLIRVKLDQRNGKSTQWSTKHGINGLICIHAT